jgi:hypothetical protein
MPKNKKTSPVGLKINDAKGETFALRIEKAKLQGFLHGCRIDMHEPDEQEVTAKVTGRTFDNAGFDHEKHVVLTRGTDHKETFKINLATLIAIARLQMEFPIIIVNKHNVPLEVVTCTADTVDEKFVELCEKYQPGFKAAIEPQLEWDGDEGQDRKSYTDEQDRDSYTVDPDHDEAITAKKIVDHLDCHHDTPDGHHITIYIVGSEP